MEKSQRRLDEAMFDLVHRLDFFVFGIGNPDALVEFCVDRHVDVFVNRGADDRTSMIPVERRKIAAASHEAHSQRCPADDHH